MRILIAIGVQRQKEAGAAGVVFNHARELENLGHSVECLFLDDVLELPRRFERFEAWQFARKIAKRVRLDPGKFDIVNIHAPWGGAYGLHRKLFGKGGTPPYVLTMQGSEERYVQMMKREDRKGRATHFGWKNKLWHRLYHQTMYDLAILTADYGAVANREAWALAELKYKLHPGMIWYVPNGVEEHFIRPRTYLDAKPTKLLYVGTWIDRKGVFYLADAFCQIVQKKPEVTLTVAGCGVPEALVKDSFAPEFQNNVKVVPFVRREEMSDVYATHDIFVFPSLVEGMPLTLLEAMASGMPVVTTNSSGMSDLVEDEFNGLLVQPAETEKLVEAIERLLHSTELRERLGLAGQSTTLRYTWKQIGLKLEKIFLQAIQTRQKS